MWIYSAYSNVLAAHEAGHLMGVPDDYGDPDHLMYYSTNPYVGPPPHLSDWEYHFLLSGSNPQIHRSCCCGK